MPQNYLDKLRDSARETRSIACMGLDPVVEAMPEKYSRHGIKGMTLFFESIFEEMIKQRVFPGAFKPNAGFYLKHDRALEEKFGGSKTLAGIINGIKISNSLCAIPIILDYKRGDIAKSSQNYAEEGFESWNADAVTISPYMGTDSVMPFIETAQKHGGGVYILNRTSNPGAKDFQNLEVVVNDVKIPLYMVVANKVVEWAQGKPGVGAVVGATSLDELTRLAKLYAGKDIPLLIPGVGGQGGKANEVVARLRDAGYDLSMARINSSSDLTHPWAKKKEQAPDDYAKICVENLSKLNNEIGYAA